MTEEDTGNQPVALVTGSAGFIGFHTCTALLNAGWRVVGVDAMTSYYDVTLKERRHELLAEHPRFSRIHGAIETPGLLTGLMAEETPEVVIHLAAQAGVRYSIEAPASYVTSNLDGTFALLEAARAHPPRHLLMASTSSVYGAGRDMPFTETAPADRPLSFYAATKKANEAMAHSYAHIYGLPITMFRFFTVYGPWGRPDMALFKFTRAILEGRPIDVYNHGDMKRDFTYVDDLVAALVPLIEAVPESGKPVGVFDSLSPVAPFRVVNIGNGKPEALMDFIDAIEAATGRKAEHNFLPMQPGDVPATWADTQLLRELTGDAPETDMRQGVVAFVDWYRSYYG